MLLLIAHTTISTLYITSYQHVYSEPHPLALILGQTSSLTEDILEDRGYSVEIDPSAISDLTGYDVIILEGPFTQVALDSLEDYVQGGGGLVYTAGSVGSLDLAANYDWLGAQTIGASGLGENVTVSIDNPLDSSLLEGTVLRLQSVEQEGAIWVDNLEPGADVLARYTSGNVFAYSYDSDGRVYFQAYSDAGVGDAEAQVNAEQLLGSGIIWATAEPEVSDLLPPGYTTSAGHNKPANSMVVEFSQPGFQSQELAVPDDPVKQIFVTADAGLINPRLYFTIDGQEYRYNIQTDKGTLLDLPSNMNITDASYTVDGWSSGVGRVGFITFNAMPSCNIPSGASVTPSSIPHDAVALGSTGPAGGVGIDSPPVPVSSLLAGFDHETSGYVLGFNSSFECPIQPAAIEITFDEPIVLSDARVVNDGPWGLVGYAENLGDAIVYVKISLPKGTALPSGFTVEPSSDAPTQIHSVSFSESSLEVHEVTEPNKKVSALWVSADTSLVDPHMYLLAGEEWHSIEIDQAGSSLVRFVPSIQIDEIYAAADAGSGSVSVSYAYPVTVDARAGSDQTVLEEQMVYLDGRGSTGPVGSLSFKWTQIDGPSVTLRDANTATANFAAPEVDEQGERLSFRLAVTDSDGSLSSDTIVINIKNEAVPNNFPPVIGAIAEARVEEGSQVVISASAFDSDGDTLKYSWLQKDGPAAKLSGTNTPSLSIVAPAVTSESLMTFEIKVGDGRGHAVTKDVVVTVLNIRDEILPTEPAISAGSDKNAIEGSVVLLEGEYSAETNLADLRWEQTAGIPVTLNVQSALRASFAAPQIDEDSSVLIFRLAEFDSRGNAVRWDDVSITLNNSVNVTPVDDTVDIEEEEPDDPSSFDINEPSFAAVERVDTVPPSEIHLLSILGVEGAISPTPTVPVVGVWINATAEMTDLELHFSSSGRKYSIDIMADQATAYVFDRQVDIQDIRLASSSTVQTIGIGYYYDQIPLTSIPPPTPQLSPLEGESDVLPSAPPTEGVIIKFARENQFIAAFMAIGVPVGIGIGLKMASTHRRNKDVNPAVTLFPKHDPVAGEAEKVRPVIEELEKMLGRDLDTAVSASELLDKFASGRSEASQR